MGGDLAEKSSYWKFAKKSIKKVRLEALQLKLVKKSIKQLIEDIGMKSGKKGGRILKKIIVEKS